MYGNDVVCSEGSALEARSPTVTERLESEKKNLELRLAAVIGLLEDLDANPETKSILDKLSQLGHRVY
jgi:uncharacterized protein (UPF0147 family)